MTDIVEQWTEAVVDEVMEELSCDPRFPPLHSEPGKTLAKAVAEAVTGSIGKHFEWAPKR